jgi:hypothetical protein
VELGAIGQEAIEVRSGLAQTDEVIVAPADRLADGARVEPIG